MRDWIAGIVGEDMATGAMLVVVTLAIVIAFSLLFTIFKAFSGGGVRSSKRARQPRLTVMDAAIVDSRRRLVLIRRDDVEHLILIGGPTDVVVEQNINRLAMAKQGKTQHPRSQPAMVAAMAQQPVAAVPPAARTQAPASAKSTPAPSPQIRPATTPPAPVSPPVQAAVATPSIITKTANINPPLAAETVKSAPEIAPVTVAPRATTPPNSPSRPTTSVERSVVIPASTPTPTPASTTAAPTQMSNTFSSRGPVLAKAAASSVATAASDVATSEKSVVPESDSGDTKGDKTDVKSENITENRLADFEDNLAMNLGETLVPEALMPAEKDSLASEMDELLSEITASSKR